MEAGESVCWYSFCVSWKSLNTHVSFALRKLPCLSVLMVSTHRPVTNFFGLTFLMSMRSKTSLSTQDLYSRCFASHLGSCSCCFSAGGHAAFKHVSCSTVNPCETSSFVLPESLVTSLRHNDPCTHGIVIKLQTSCCSPSSVVTEQNDPAAAAYLCVSGVTVQCSSSVRALRSGWNTVLRES